jgi:hypothetical protein
LPSHTVITVSRGRITCGPFELSLLIDALHNRYTSLLAFALLFKGGLLLSQPPTNMGANRGY